MPPGEDRDAPHSAGLLVRFLGLLGAALLLGGGLSSIQALALATAFPFVLIMMMMIVSLFLGLRAERVLLVRGEVAG